MLKRWEILSTWKLYDMNGIIRLGLEKGRKCRKSEPTRKASRRALLSAAPFLSRCEERSLLE